MSIARWLGLVVAVISTAWTCAHAADVKNDYTADDFVTSYWCGPTAEFTTFERYQEIKNANFTVAFPIFGSATVAQNRSMLDFCQKLGMKGIIYDNRIPSEIGGSAEHKHVVDEITADFANHPALLGYSITDEPVAGAFDALGQVTAYLRERDPKHPGYINIMPNWARDIPGPAGSKFSYLGTPTYEAYVRQFVQKTKPAWLCYDHYAMLKGGDRPDFWENLETVRRVALESNIPFWNIVLLTQHGDYRILSENELRFEAMQTLAFGARGLVWFTYWNVGVLDKMTTWTNAMIETNGSRNPHYEMVKTINAEVLALGRELKNAKSVAVIQHDGPKGAAIRVGQSPASIEAGKITLGAFDEPAGRHYALLASLDYKAATAAEIAFEKSVSLERFDAAKHTWSAIQLSSDKSLELDLAPAAATLLRW